jgi:hypothetical protein
LISKSYHLFHYLPDPNLNFVSFPQ